MDNRIITKEDILAAPKKVKKNVYKVSTQYATDRNKAMRAIFEEDEKAEFKHKDRWTFKVKTTLALNDINKIFMYKSYEYSFKKIRFF